MSALNTMRVRSQTSVTKSPHDPERQILLYFRGSFQEFRPAQGDPH
jgi:hypothetical protein